MGLFDLARLAPQLARTPVHFAQAVENGAADAELGVGAELHVLGVIELVEGVDQPDHAGMHQIFERDMARQPLVDAAREITDLGQLFEQDAVAFFLLILILVLPAGIGCGGVLAHGILTSRSRIKTQKYFPQRKTPTDCTSTTGGTSGGESTTSLGRKGSSSRLR